MRSPKQRISKNEAIENEHWLLKNDRRRNKCHHSKGCSEAVDDTRYRFRVFLKVELIEITKVLELMQLAHCDTLLAFSTLNYSKKELAPKE